MKKTLFIITASALLLGCSSNNAEVKADTATPQTDSVVETAVTEFDSLLLCFPKSDLQPDANSDTIPDRYCYDFLQITKDSMFFKFKAFDYDADKYIPASGKLKIRPELMKKSENYVLLIYSTCKNVDGEKWDGSDRYYYLKTFTPDGTLIQSLDNIAMTLYGDELFKETKDYYLKNDSTLYIVHLSTANDNIYSGEMPTEANDTATVVELTKYSVLKNGHIDNSGHKKFTLQQPYFLGEEGHEPGALIYKPRNEKEARYKVWTENLK